jgi:hypothetical protein
VGLALGFDRAGSSARSYDRDGRLHVEAVPITKEQVASYISPFKVRVAIVEPGIIATPMATRPRTIPPPGPYSTTRRRFGAVFAESLKTPTSPFEVAKVIQDIVDGRSTKLRNPAGSDGNNFIQWRKKKTDEEWVSLGALDDAGWAADIKKNIGLDIKLQ